MRFFMFVLLLSVTVANDVREMFSWRVSESASLDALNKYAERMQKEVDTLRQQLTGLETLKAGRTPSGYHEHPISIYRLIRRLAAAWTHVRSMAGVVHNDRFSSELERNERDLEHAQTTVLRIQHVYGLEASQIAEGRMTSEVHSDRLTLEECLQLGRHAYELNKFEESLGWIEQAMVRYLELGKRDENTKTVLELGIRLLFKLGRQGSVPDFANNLLTMEPVDIQLGLEMIKIIETIDKNGDGIVEKTQEEEEYRKLCQNRHKVDERQRAKLKCRYQDSGSTYLKIGPMWEEDVHLEPKIRLYHNVLSAQEAETIRRRSQQNGNLGVILKDTKISARLLRRIEHMTGLSGKTLELFDYQVGDHDFLINDHKEGLATVLLYFTDVTAGGATVFPSIQLSVLPRKGSMLFWHKHLSNGQPDTLTKGAECPLIIGPKLVGALYLS